MRAAVLLLALALGACAPEVGDRIAGAEIDEGGFGNPTLTNRLVMSGVLSHAKTVTGYGRTRGTGLNGKYAEVIFGEYVESALPRGETPVIIGIPTE